VLATMLVGSPSGWPGALLAQPAAWAVPLTFATMIAVSEATRRRVRSDIGLVMVRLHAPELVVAEISALPNAP